MTYKGRERRYELSPTRGAIAKSLGRNSKQAFANHSFKSQAVRNHLLARIHRTIRQEMKNILTSRDCTVTLNGSNPGIFTSDAWENQFTALQHVAPVLTGILNASIPRNSSRRQCTMASCIGILVKSHGRSTLAHLFTSLILYSGHAAKQVLFLLSHKDFKYCEFSSPTIYRCTQGCRNLACAFLSTAL